MIYPLSCLSDPLIHHGRHFGRTVHALCSVHSVILNGVLRQGELADEPLESFTSEFVHFIDAFLQILIAVSQTQTPVPRL